MNHVQQTIRYLLSSNKQWRDMSPVDINDGWCEDFANQIQRYCSWVVICNGPYHTFVYDPSTYAYYDAEVEFGVESRFDLPFYQRNVWIDQNDWAEFLIDTLEPVYTER